MLWRWRDVIGGLFLASAGIWVFLAFFGWARWLGIALATIGVMSIWTGRLRARFLSPKDGPGIVEIDERQLSYFGPFGGSSLSLDDINQIEIESGGHGAHWIFGSDQSQPLRIPASAQGAEGLLDELGRFGGAKIDAAIELSRSSTRDRRLIWKKGD